MVGWGFGRECFGLNWIEVGLVKVGHAHIVCFCLGGLLRPDSVITAQNRSRDSRASELSNLAPMRPNPRPNAIPS